MTDMISYLSNYREETPAWLENYLQGERITFKDIMSSRVGYYPGYNQRGNCDGTLIKVGNKSHTVHSFLYVDSVKRDVLEKQIARKDSFRGYHSIGTIKWQESDLMPSGRHQILRPISKVQETPYCFSLVMERDEDKDDTWGDEHFVVTFLYGISINVYYWLFRKEYSNAPWLFLLNEFSRGTALDQEIHRSLLFPRFVMFAINVTPWDGYEKVENVSPVFGEFKERRDLYVCHRLS